MVRSAKGTTIVTLDQLAVAHGWRVILLQRNKRPIKDRNDQRVITTDPAEIRRHRGNFGLMGGPESFAVLDFDVPGGLLEMSKGIAPLLPTVQTGSGKYHCYVRWVPELPRSFFWKGQLAGEIIRLASEYAVCPPSIHPVTGRPYRWLVDPREPLPELPAEWRRYLDSADARATSRVSPPSRSGPWTGPSAEELLRRAAQQPGAKRRSFGIKFQCAGCRAEGHDRSMDNATVFTDGRWGCALDADHRRAIGESLGAVAPSVPRLYRLQGLRGLRGL